jgi:thiol-disulfide isomerase/thioredoxin/outer membrane lipoprotein-sorting protein
MRGASRGFPLALLLAAALAPGARAAGPAPSVATALLDSTSAHYARMREYHFEGVVLTTMTGAQLPVPMQVPMAFVYASRMPGRVHNSTQAQAMSSFVVADGESLWVYSPEMKQYVVRAAPRVEPGQAPSGEFGPALQPLLAFASLREDVSAVTDAGADTVVTAAGPVRCRRLSLTYPRDTVAHTATMLPRQLWIDEARHVVVRDSITIEFDNPQAGHVRRVQDMRFTRLEPDEASAESLYHFQPPADAHRVAMFGNAPPPMPELVGKPAIDFTLPALAGGPTVSLARLKGKVVVLDFWATWCGPCRRWMPIVAKLEQQLKGRDVRFFAVNLMESPVQVREFLKHTGTVPPVLLDRDGKVGNAYGAASIPLTVVIGRNGKVAQVLIGLHPEEDLKSALRAAGVQGV